MKPSTINVPAPPPLPSLTFEYDPATGNLAIKFAGGGIPAPLLVNAIELVKVRLLQQQLVEQNKPRSRVLMADGTPSPFAD